MIKLNLLSPQKKKEVEDHILYSSLKNVLGVLLIFVIFISIILLGSKLILAKNFETIVEQTTLIVKEYGGVNQNIRTINEKLKNISNTQNEFVTWSYHLSKLQKLIPENIEISTIILKKGNKESLVKGLAKNRDDLLTLKTNLENSDLFTVVELPFSNLLTRNNIDFELQLTLSELTYAPDKN